MIGFSSVTKMQGGKTLYKNASFTAQAGDRVGIVGPNGAGKSTIFRILTGNSQVDGGEIIKPGKIKIGYFNQDVGEMSGRSLLEEVMSGVAEITDLSKKIKTMEEQFSVPMGDDDMAKLLEEYGEAQSRFEAAGGYDLDSRAKEIISGLGFKDSDYDRGIEHFSGGWKMRAALGKILLLNPDVIFLDEPTNHLDLESIIWLEQWLKDFKGTLLLTSHDRIFMNNVVNRIIEISHSNMTLYSGDYEFYLREREVRKEQLVAQYKRQQAMLQKEEEFIAKFAARASHAAQVQSRVKKLEKIERIEIPPEQKIIRFEFKTPPRSGENVVELNNVSKNLEIRGWS